MSSRRVRIDKDVGIVPEKLAPPGTVSTVKVESVFPTPSQVLALEDPTTTLRSAGLSGRKVEYILGLAERFLDGRLQASKLWEMEDEEVKKALLDVRGIGLWTVHVSSSPLVRRSRY
jgi:DNA-3-methyladenine glycosylase II